MDIRTNDNRILGGFRPRMPVVLIFALGLVLGSLTFAFAEVPVFGIVAFTVLGLLIFMTSRDILPLGGIVVPGLFAVIATGTLGAPALYIGAVFCLGVTVYLCLGGRFWAPLLAAGTAYAAAAFVLDPVKAIPVAVPVLIGMIASAMLPSFGLAATAGTLSALILSAGAAVLAVQGTDFAAVGDSLREMLTQTYMGFNSEFIIIEDKTAQMLAAQMVNILPGLIFAALSAVVYIALSLAVSLFRSSGVEDRLPEDIRIFRLSPVSGVIYIIAFFLSAAFTLEGGDFEMAAAVAENINVGLSLAFMALGCTAARNFLMNRIFRSLPSRRRVSGAAVAMLFILAPGLGFAVFLAAGLAESLMPIYKYLLDKIKSSINKEQ